MTIKELKPRICNIANNDDNDQYVFAKSWPSVSLSHESIGGHIVRVKLIKFDIAIISVVDIVTIVKLFCSNLPMDIYIYI